MATNKRDLRAYVRYDGTGRIIPGSLVLRRSKPKVGDWKEIQTYECCDGGGNNGEPTITPIELCAGPLTCSGGTCPETIIRYIYQYTIDGISFAKLSIDQDSNFISNGFFEIKSNGKLLVVSGGGITNIGDCV